MFNFWPFKKRVVKTWEQVVQEQPDVECGDKTSHYTWTFNGCPCFNCVALAKQREREKDEDRLAEKIAQAIIRSQASRQDIQPIFGE